AAANGWKTRKSRKRPGSRGRQWRQEKFGIALWIQSGGVSNQRSVRRVVQGRRPNDRGWMQSRVIIRKHRHVQNRIDLRIRRARAQLRKRVRRVVVDKRSVRTRVSPVGLRIAGQ